MCTPRRAYHVHVAGLAPVRPPACAASLEARSPDVHDAFEELIELARK
jgi:hypothetical protein